MYSFNDPPGFIAAYQQNASCDQFTSRETPCVQGNYVEYAIDVQEAADIVAGLSFVKESNIRLVIKNTGHKYSYSFQVLNASADLNLVTLESRLAEAP